MKNLGVVVLFSFLTLPAWAESGSVVIAVGFSEQAPAVRLEVPADYVAVPISIQGEAKEADKRADQVETVLRAVQDKLRQYPDLSVKLGVVSLSGRGQSGSKVFSSYDSYRESSAQLYVLGPLKQDTNVFATTKRIYQAIKSVPIADGTRIVLGNTALGINEPEKFRPTILRMIAKTVSETKKELGMAGEVELDGLENRVSVMQLNEKKVVLYVDYKLKIHSKSK